LFGRRRRSGSISAVKANLVEQAKPLQVTIAGETAIAKAGDPMILAPATHPRRLKVAVLAVACALIASGTAKATCRWTFVNGQQQQLCDSPTDRPARKPLLDVVPPMLPAAMPPIRPAVIPPLGTASCSQAQVWNGSVYRWQTLCQ
jgi:hypothetical protein